MELPQTRLMPCFAFMIPAIYLRQGFSALTFDTLDQVAVLCCRGSAVRCGMLSGTPGLYPLDTSSTLIQPHNCVTVKTASRCSQLSPREGPGAKSPSFESHSYMRKDLFFGSTFTRCVELVSKTCLLSLDNWDDPWERLVQGWALTVSIVLGSEMKGISLSPLSIPPKPVKLFTKKLHLGGEKTKENPKQGGVRRFIGKGEAFLCPVLPVRGVLTIIASLDLM